MTYYKQPGQFLPGNPMLNAPVDVSGYSLNSLSYRAPEFDTVDWNNSIVVFGCSMALGLGLDDSDTVTARLEEISGITVINMGCSGSGIMHSLYNQMALKEQGVSPHAVVNLWTNLDRVTYFMPEKAVSVGSWTNNDTTLRSLFVLWNNYQSNPEGYIHLARRISDLLWSDCARYHASFFSTTATALGVDELKIIDVALDQTHPGPKSMLAAAETIYNSIKEHL